jgi:hypothetical protein
MPAREQREKLELMQGTLDLLILRTLILGKQNGQGIARAILQSSHEELLVEHGSTLPCNGWKLAGGYRPNGDSLITTAKRGFIR